MKNDKNILETLRQKAEHLISADKNSNTRSATVEVKRIFHELQIYQLELEMQNDELQLTTAELEQQRIKFTNLFELAPVSYFVLSKSGLIKDVNNAASKLLGIGKFNLVNKPMVLFIHPEDTDLFYKHFQKLVMLPQPQSFQIRMHNSKNQLLNVQVDGNSMRTPTETECYLTVTDFTGKQQAEKQLKEAKKTLDFALNASSTGIWEIDITTSKVYLDDFCCRLYGFNPDDFNGQYETLLNGIHTDDRKNVDDNIRRTIFNDNDFNIRFRTNSFGKDLRYIHARAQVIKERDEKKRFIGTFTDISEKTVIEQEAAQIKEEQQQMILAAGLLAEEKEKKRISEVLHDGIAQMLYAIKLNIFSFKEGPGKPEVFEQVNQLLNQSIRDIRNISFELAPSILTDFGLGPTLEDLTGRLSNSQLHFTTKVSGIHKTIDFQLQLNIFRIIQELINNAIKHATASKIAIEVIKKNKDIAVTVSDNGIGFEPENQTEPPKGIGLSSIKNRLRLYKGTIKIESGPETGTTVYINLKH